MTNMATSTSPASTVARWRCGVTLLVLLAGCSGVFGRVDNVELTRLFLDDQADRSGTLSNAKWEVVRSHDAARRNRVIQIEHAGRMKTAADYYHGAMVFQHGDEVADIQQARKFALAAVGLSPDNREARWLAAAARDRELMYLDEPQQYGTQFVANDAGVWELYPVDPKTTDSERARWNVPPLDAQKRRADALNRK